MVNQQEVQSSEEPSSHNTDESNSLNFKLDVNFKRDTVLGRGASGKVYQVHLPDFGIVAVKEVDKDLAKLAEDEFKTVMKAKHKNVIKHHAFFNKPNAYYIVQELCSGTLQQLLDSDPNYGFSHRIELLKGIALGLEHLHGLGIIHRDLKPTNVLIKYESHEHIPVIADFGISRILQPDRHEYTVTDKGLSSRLWSPAEVYDGKEKHITQALDIFAYGCLMYYTLCPKTNKEIEHPFGYIDKDGIGLDYISNAIIAGHRKYFLTNFINEGTKKTNIPKIILSDILVQDLTQRNPSNRPDISHVLNFPLFWNTSKQINFVQNLFNYVVKVDRESFEKNWNAFYNNEYVLGRLKMKSSDNNTDKITELLNGAGFTSKVDLSLHISFEVCRIIRNAITHFMEPSRKGKRSMEELFMGLHKNFPFLLPLLWVSYRFLQIPAKYCDKLEYVKEFIKDYYHTVKNDINPECLVTDLNFIFQYVPNNA